MGKAVDIRIETDGSFIFLTHGDDALLKIGQARIVRASHVQFDNDTKRWFVYLRLQSGVVKKCGGDGFDRRSEAIEFEGTICEQLLKSDPDAVRELVDYGAVRDASGHETSG